MPRVKTDTRDFRNLSRRFKKAERDMPRMKSARLNNAAFETRSLIQEEITKSMTIRTPNLVRSKVVFRKASPYNLKSKAGTRDKARFSGWEEQQNQKGPERKRSQSLNARRGKFQNRVAPRYRLRGQTKVLSVKNTKTKEGGRFQGMDQFLAYLSNAFKKERSKPLFLIGEKYGSLARGIYTFVRGMKIKIIHIFDPPDTKPNRFLNRATERYIHNPKTRRSWANAVKNSLGLFNKKP